MGTLYDNELLPTSVQDAIRQFEYRYEAAVTSEDPPGWAEEIGDKYSSSSPLTRFPISLIVSRFTQFRGDIRTRELEDKYSDVKTIEHQDGFEVPAIDLTTNVVRARQWSKVPAELVNGEKRLQNQMVTTALEAGTSGVNVWDSEFFFDTDHLANPNDPGLGTWSNYQSSTKDPASITNITAEVSLMQAVPGPDGLRMGVDPDTILLPVAKGEPVRTLLAQNFLANGQTNPYFNRFKVVIIPTLTDTNDWYLVDSKLLGRMPPWTIVEYVPAGPLGMALRLRWFDENSDYFKNTGRLKVSSHVHLQAALMFPHAIRRIAGA